jgi:thioredoxin reductase
VKVPGYGKLNYREIRKESLIDVWEDIVTKTGLEVTTGETVTDVRRNGAGFVVTSDRETYRATYVILAIGRRGVPRKLEVPGEELPKVAYSLREPEAFQNDRIAVIGGGDSAIEAALALAEHGNEVTISYRREAFSRIKPQNHDRVEDALQTGLIDILWRTKVIAIEPKRVILRNDREQTGVIRNDYAFIFAGGELPTKFLRACGVEIDTKFGAP